MADTWRPLSSFARDLHTTARRLGLARTIADLRASAATVAEQHYGRAVLLGAPELINVAALALSLDPLVIHVVQPEVVELVDTTDLHALPDDPPRLLHRAWIVESRWERGEVLFGDTASLGSYALDGTIYLVGLGIGGWARVARWTPHWTGDDIAASVPHETSPLVDDGDAQDGWTRQAARFAVIFGLLLDAEARPRGSLTRATGQRHRRSGRRSSGRRRRGSRGT